MAQDAKLNNKPVQLHVIHSWRGGVERWVKDYSRTDVLRSNLVLKSLGVPGVPGQKLELYQHIDAESPIRVWELSVPIHSTSITNLDYRYALDEIFDTFNVSAILISSFIGHSLDIINTHIETVIICHDYYPFCPAINIYFDQVCIECKFSHLQSCFKENKHNTVFPLASASEWIPIRESFLKLIQYHEIMLIFPSNSVRRNLIKLEPALQDIRFKVIPHGVERETAFIKISQKNPSAKKLKILILGRLLFHKGLGLLKETYKEILEIADIYLLGCGEEGRSFEGVDGIYVVAENYSLEDLEKTVEEISPDLGLLLSIVPETFSYTLSELFILKIPTLATRVGSFEERIQEGINGFLVAPEKNALIKKIRELSEQRQLLANVANHLESKSHRTLTEMVDDYHEVVTLATLPPKHQVSGEFSLLSLTQAEFERSQAQILKTQAELEQLRTQLQQKEAAIERSHLQLQQTHAELEQSHLQLQQTHAELEQSHLQLQQTHAELERSHLQLQQTHAELERSHLQLQQAEARITAMESSKFWKLRKAWHRLKPLMGLKSNE
jgi:glycosyltransferase involved in cell wall biosynthesis